MSAISFRFAIVFMTIVAVTTKCTAENNDSKITCKSIGGECIANCPLTIQHPEACDCPPKTTCCVWLT
ncbi:hypothetical protein Bhyg_03747 [Pseudolycoriella hygida]|uniref:Uncharacterized protein n=1 Tax=Pseudolycoriella hygida TaxID=35572 RepID=A0A9Q0S7S3_9DIPT|nr:hypothetical protein Bhyg_03747 [Pseudolycoriella hygida]